MVQDKRSLHLRLQEYCDCFVETDPMKELDSIEKEGKWADMQGKGHEEVALKFLSLAILYGIKENAKRISIVKDQKGEVQFNVEATGKYKLPAPSSVMADHVFDVMRSLTHVESDKASQRLALGLRNDGLELQVSLSKAEDKQSLDIDFP